MRYILGAEPTDIFKIAVNQSPNHPGVDRSMRAAFDFPNDVTGSIYSDFSMPKRSILGPTPFFRIVPRIPSMIIKVFGEEGEIYLNNFAFPTVYHTIYVTKGKDVQTVKAYTAEKLSGTAKGDASWST